MGLRGLRTSYRKKERGPDEIRTEQTDADRVKSTRAPEPSIAPQRGRVNADAEIYGGDIASVSRLRAHRSGYGTLAKVDKVAVAAVVRGYAVRVEPRVKCSRNLMRKSMDAARIGLKCAACQCYDRDQRTYGCLAMYMIHMRRAPPWHVSRKRCGSRDMRFAS